MKNLNCFFGGIKGCSSGRHYLFFYTILHLIKMTEKSETLSGNISNNNSNNDPPKYEAKLARVKEIDWTNVAVTRGGIILYTDKGVIMGIDAKYEDLTDFGGSIEYDNSANDRKKKKIADINCLTGSCREFYEETLGVFGQLDPLSLEDAPVVMSTGDTMDEMLIIMVRADIMWDRSYQLFNERRQRCLENGKSTEMKKIVRLSYADFDSLIAGETVVFKGRTKNHKMYEVIRNLLKDAMRNGLKDIL